MIQTSPDRRYRRCADVRFRLVDGEAVVLRQAAGENLVLNRVGSRILQLVDGGSSVGEVAKHLISELEVTAEQLEEDLLPFLQELEEAGVVEPVPAAAAPPRAENT